VLPLIQSAQKQSPVVGVYKRRYFFVDSIRGALVYYADEARATFKGAIPLPLIARVVTREGERRPTMTNADRIVDFDIPGRTFALRLPDSAETAQRDAFVKALLDAVAAQPDEPEDGGAPLPAGHWKIQERYTARQPKAQVGARSRSAHPGYPPRRAPIAGAAGWDVALPTYEPPELNPVASGPGPAALATWSGQTRMDAGVPLNPAGRMGLRGRGELPRSGANQELRVIVSRVDETGASHIVVVRKAAGEWQLPGGFLPVSRAGPELPTAKLMQQAFYLQAASGVSSDKNGPRLDAIFKPAASARAASAPPTNAPPPASAPAAAPPAKAPPPASAPAAAPAAEPMAEALAETRPSAAAPAAPAAAAASEAKAEEKVKVEQPAWLVHLGLCDHSANTDNAWIESAVGHFPCSREEGADLLLGEGAGIKDARWIKVPSAAERGGGFWADLRPAHRQWVRLALLKHGISAG